MTEDELRKLEQLADDPVLGIQEQGDVLAAVLEIRVLRIKLERVRAYAQATEAMSESQGSGIHWRIAKELLSILDDTDPPEDIWPCKCVKCADVLPCSSCGVGGGEICKIWCEYHPGKDPLKRSHAEKPAT